MGLVRSLDEISALKKNFPEGFVLSDVAMVMVMFRTKAEVIKRVLPPPLEPAPEPMGSAYVAEFHRTNFGPAYNEAALFIQAQYKGEVGGYCLAMPVTNDMAMVRGRESVGFPKKIAETIHVERKGNRATGICARRGINIIEIKVNLTGPVEPDAIPPVGPNYLFKHSMDPSGDKFDYNPRLMRQFSEIHWGKTELGEGELTLAESKYDPIYEIPVEEVLVAGYTEGMEIRMQRGEVIAEADPIKFLPYSFIKSDWPIE